MKRGRAITLVVLLTIIATVVAFIALRPHEPVYQGKRLGEWLNEWDTFNVDTNAPTAEAIRQMGTNAFPHLIRLLRSKDSALKRKLMELLEKQSLIRIDLESADDHHQQGRAGFYVLGNLAAPAIPELSKLLNAEDTSLDAAVVLIFIGPEAVLTLAQALTNSNATVRASVASALAQAKWNAKAAVPNLLRCLSDKEPNVRLTAALALGLIHEEPETVIPVLITRLEDTDVNVREQAANALRRFGKPARSSVPALLKATESRDGQMARFAIAALKAIDPEAAAKAGVK